MSKLTHHIMLLVGTSLLIWGCGGGGGSSTPTGPSALDMQITTLLLDEAPGKGANAFILPESENLLAIPQDPKNPLTPEKVALGKLLYHDCCFGLNGRTPALAQTYSCASCHFAAAGFAAGRVQGLSDGGSGFGLAGEKRVPNPTIAVSDVDSQPVRTPTIVNCAYQIVQLWNGQFGATGPNVGTQAGWTAGTPKVKNFLGYEGVETQAIGGQIAHRLRIDATTVAANGYTAMFDAAYPSVPVATRYSDENAGLAIAAYERTVLANRSPWQMYLKGNLKALTDSQKAGAVLFFGKANCVACHTGPALNTMSFEGIGLNDMYQAPGSINATSSNPENLGRGGFTGVASDNYKFKVPTLYNKGQSPFLGHGASLHSIFEMVNYMNAGIAQNKNVPPSQLSPKFVPLGLSTTEVSQLTDFLQNSLSDPYLSRYQPGSVSSGSAIPVNDRQSRIDILGHP